MPFSAGDRVIADVALADRLSVGIYGECYRAHGRGRRDLRALVVDARLAAEPAFAEALLATPQGLIAFAHDAVVGTLAVAQSGTDLVAIVEAGGEVSVHDLLTEVRSRSSRLPAPVAAAIARSVFQALAAAHRAGLIHGAVHPRSVLIAPDGTIKLTDFAVGRALNTAVARGADASLARVLAGYLAPELALGEEAGPPADVYAAGALLFAVLTGETPPGTLHQTPAIERLVQRALDTDLARRFGDAGALARSFEEALEDDGWTVATPAEVVALVAELRGAETNLDSATEDLLASLGASFDSPAVSRPDLESFRFDGAPEPTNELETLLADLDDTGDEPLTQVDPSLMDARIRDPISEIIALADDDAPTRIDDPGRVALPSGRLQTPARAAVAVEPPTPRREVSLRPTENLRLDDMPSRVATPRPATRTPAPSPVSTSPSAPAAAPVAPWPHPAPPRLDSVPSPRFGSASAAPQMPAPRVASTSRDASEAMFFQAPTLGWRSRTWLWALLLVAGVAALVWVIMSQIDLNRRADQQRAAKVQAAAGETARLTAELPDPGTVRIRSTPSGAAVWLLLGRTPTASFPVPTGMLHELRVELEDHQPRDVQVLAKDWSGPATAQVARVTVPLTVGARERPLPAIPPTPAEAKTRGFTRGRGVIRVESTPPGAEVWLLVGITDEMELAGIEAGRDYELRVQKDGFAPSYVRISAEEWRNGGDPRLPLSAAPKKPVIERQVELVVAPKKGK